MDATQKLFGWFGGHGLTRRPLVVQPAETGAPVESLGKAASR